MAEPILDSNISTSSGASQPLPEVSREEVLKQIFGDVGDLIDVFSCAVESTVLLHGRMYITSRFICFYSNLFGLEKKIRIPYSHIKSISKENTALVIPNAIAISTDKRDYIFRSFWDRDICFRMVSNLLDRFRDNGKIEGIRVKAIVLDSAPSSAPSQPTSATTATNSPPINSTAVSVDVSRPISVSLESLKSQNQFVETARPVSMIIEPSRPLPAIPDSTRPVSVALEALKAIPNNQAPISTSTNPVISESSNATSPSETLDNGSQDMYGRRLSTRKLSAIPEVSQGIMSANIDDVVDTESIEVKTSPDTDLNSQFQEEAAKARLKLPVNSSIFDISLQDFAALFINENAPFSFKRYHESVKDTNVISAPWEDMGQLGFGREIKFFKPVNLPGLASTRGVKIQKFRKFGEFGLILWSSTRLEDVPAADTFSVDDVILVNKISNNTINVEISFQVTFMKGTFMKYIIEKSTNAEMAKWLETFFQHLKKTSNSFKEGKLTLEVKEFTTAVSPDSQHKELPVNTAVLIAEPTEEIQQQSPSPKKQNEKFAMLSDLFDSFATDSFYDKLKFLLFIFFLGFIFMNYIRWRAVNIRLIEVETKLKSLQSLLDTYLSELKDLPPTSG